MENENNPEFNLIYEPWIIVRTAEGARQEVSLLDVFKNAQQYHSLAGELPAQDTAVLRLLLAIMHGALGGKDINGTPFPDDTDNQIDGALELWKTLWSDGLPYDRIKAYLEEFEDRFYLFHEKTPFYQIPGLDKRDDVFGPFNVAKLNGEISESDNKIRLFQQRAGDEKTSLSYAESIRWLLYYNSYTETFGKLEGKGKTGKSDLSVGVGWLGKLGLVSVVGNNLFQTLMLNFVLLDKNENPWRDGKPIWEKPVNLRERNAIPLPASQVELLTLQSRRVQLERNNDRVVSFRFVSGDIFPQEEAFSEMMTAWRYGKQQNDKNERYRPKPFQSSVQLWRDFASLVVQSEVDGRRMPGVIWWLKHLIGEGILPSESHFRFQTSGITYGTMQAAINDVFSDSLSFNAGLLSDLHSSWITNIIDELGLTDKLVREVGNLAQNIARAAGIKDGRGEMNHGATARDEAKSMTYYRLDDNFRLWLESIDPVTDKIYDKCDEWWGIAQSIVRAYGREIIGNCSPQALVGRSNQSAVEAYNWFLYYTKNKDTLNMRGVRKRGKESGSNT